MLKDKAGNRLFRKVTIKIVYPDNLFPEKTYSHHAGPHQGFGPDGVDDLLMQTATRLDELYPWWEFRLVELTSVGRTARFVFTYAGPRSAPSPTTVPQEFTNINPQESTTLEPATAEANTPTEVGNPLP